MPIDYLNYPPDWFEIRGRVLERAAHKCEQCGVTNHAIGWRDDAGKFHPEANSMEWDDDRCAIKLIRIVLTTAHTCTCNPKCGDMDHLLALCQRCHLRLDLSRHIQKRKANIFNRKALGDLFA